MWKIREHVPADREGVLALADRLTVGRPAWRNPDLWLEAVRNWVEGSIAAVDDDGHALLVVTDEGDGRLGGFVSVSSRLHFTGAVDAYIGELAVASWAEGRGAGRTLLDAAERWATANGYERLTLETGATNNRARGFYEHVGFRMEDVRLTKRLTQFRMSIGLRGGRAALSPRAVVGEIAIQLQTRRG